MLIVAVAAFNIVSTLVMVVTDKRGDIAILRSFGSTPRSIMALFASQGTFIGVLGTLLGVALGVGGYAASYLPSLYARSDFWTSSPTYFFVRLGILLLSIPIAYAWNRVWRGWSPLQDFGRSSLFVYWVHIELVYGLISTPLHRTLPFKTAVMGFAAFTVLMFLLVKAKERILVWWASREPSSRWPQAQGQQ
mgnify:CR=1 FL=1